MRDVRSFTWAVGTLSLSTSLSGCHTETRECTLIGCDDRVELTLPMPAKQDIDVRACEAENCASATLAASAECTELARSSELGPFSEACWGGALHDGIQLRVTLRKAASNVVYSLRVVGSTTAEVFVDAQETPVIQETYPNGRECDITPCRSGAIAFQR